MRRGRRPPVVLRQPASPRSRGPGASIPRRRKNTLRGELRHHNERALRCPPRRADDARTVARHIAAEELVGHGEVGKSGGPSSAVVAVERAARRRRPPRTRPAHSRPVRCRAPTLQPLLRNGQARASAAASSEWRTIMVPQPGGSGVSS